MQGWIRKLWTIASKMRRERMAHGSLDLDMPETKIFVDAAGYADRLEKIANDESHQLIEEVMLGANEAVARLTRTSRLPSLTASTTTPTRRSWASCGRPSPPSASRPATSAAARRS